MEVSNSQSTSPRSYWGEYSKGSDTNAQPGTVRWSEDRDWLGVRRCLCRAVLPMQRICMAAVGHEFMRIGVCLGGDEFVGGGSQQQWDIVDLVRRWGTDFDFKFYATSATAVARGACEGVDVALIPLTDSDLVVAALRRSVLLPRWFSPLAQVAAALDGSDGARGDELASILRTVALDAGAEHNAFERRLVADQIDLVFFPGPSILALLCENLNFVMTVWDLCHRDFPEFPEVRGRRQFECRDELYRECLPKATGILVDSELGRTNVARRYAVDPDRIVVAPFFAPPLPNSGPEGVASVRAKYRLARSYVFYPAQFWAHKNHTYIIRALDLARRNYGTECDAVFCGADAGNEPHVRRIAGHLGLADGVRFLGHVPREDLAGLYQASLALVMPTYFGPTNIPPLEAFELGVPVVYSNLPGLRDQVQDAAILVDLDEPASLARVLDDLVHRRIDTQPFVAAGRKRLIESDPRRYWASMEQVFRRFATRMATWKLESKASA